MPQPNTILDVPTGTTVRHGAFIAHFNLAGDLVCEECEFDKGFKEIILPNESGVDTYTAYSAGKGKGRMVVQLKTSNTVIFPGETVILKNTGPSPITNNADVLCIVTRVGARYSNQGITKIELEFAEQLTGAALPQISVYDGFSPVDGAPARAVGPIRYSRPIPFSEGAFLMKQKYAQHISAWHPIPPNFPYSPGSALLLVDETELEDTGVGGIVTWDRVYANVPGGRTEKGTCVKTYKYLVITYTPPNGPLLSAQVVSQSRTVPCDIIWNYSTNPDAANMGIGVVPDVSVVFNPPFALEVVTTGGFPFNIPPSGGGNNNNYYNFVSGEKGLYMGKIYYTKQIYA